MAVEELRKKQCARQSHSFQERPLLIACHSRRREISEDLLPWGEGGEQCPCASGSWERGWNVSTYLACTNRRRPQGVEWLGPALRQETAPQIQTQGQDFVKSIFFHASSKAAVSESDCFWCVGCLQV